MFVQVPGPARCFDTSDRFWPTLRTRHGQEIERDTLTEITPVIDEASWPTVFPS